MQFFGQQVRHVLRSLGRAPMFTAVTAITIGLGIGANTAIFSVVNGILLKPLPYPRPGELVSVMQSAPAVGIPDCELAPADYFNLREENQTFQSFGIWNDDSSTITGTGAPPERVRSLDVTEGVLNALAVQPLIGRWFTPADDNPSSPRTVILTYGYWQHRFGGDASVIGRNLMLDSEPREIIGVLPQNFRFLDDKPELILPFRFDRAKTTLGNFSFHGIARMKPGVTVDTVNADMGRMMPMVYSKFQPPPGFSVRLFEEAHLTPNARPLRNDVVGSLGKVLWVLMGSIGVVLLIACANVANLLLVRAEGRQQELAVRVAIGASWRRIAGELLMESVLLGLLGGVAGVALAYGALQLLLSNAPAFLPRIEEITIDAPVLLFTLVLSLLAGLVFGLIPVIKHAAPKVTQALRAGGRTLSQSREAHRARNTLVVLQMALAVVLLIGSGLMIRTFQALRKVQPGFTGPAELQTLRIFIPEAQVKDPERVVRMQQQMAEKLAAIPGVTSAGFANSVPTDGNNSTDLLYAEDRTYREGQFPPLRRFKFIAPGFLRAMGVGLIAGRDLTWTDVYDKREVCLVSENIAREMWHTPSAALGKRIREGMKDSWREIVGVVADVRYDGPDQKAPTTVYWPVLMSNFWGNADWVQRAVVFAVRSNGAGSESFLEEARQAVWSIDADLPITRVRTMEQVYRDSTARSSFTLVMLAAAGGMALLLGIVGIYGVISYSVSQRKREMGIRLALGAPQMSLRGMVVRHGMLLAAVGVAIGLGAAAAMTRIMASLLFEVSPLDSVTYSAVAVVLLAAAAAASYLPAHRASRVNPVDALRAE
ncbi:MAG TPA: ABC transporter permease [Bryobacteraceae bacterium]|nr:ABC transporter permease [Bryobacteraceae bacterium]